MITATITIERAQLEAAVARLDLYGDEEFLPLQRALENAVFDEDVAPVFVPAADPRRCPRCGAIHDGHGVEAECRRIFGIVPGVRLPPGYRVPAWLTGVLVRYHESADSPRRAVEWWTLSGARVVPESSPGFWCAWEEGRP